MKICSLSVLAVVFVAFCAASAQTSVSIAYNYAPISFPGARVTNVTGINTANVIVGYYSDSQYSVHGFVYQGGKYITVNFPGATMTEVLGINDYGDIVGMYQLSGQLNFHGFLRHGGAFTKIDDPSASFGTMAFGINKSGAIVGSYDNTHGFLYQNGAFRTLDAPGLEGGPYQTQLNGINNRGWIAGQVFSGGIWRGFWFANGQFHFVEPTGSTDSQATGINANGDIVGCHDSQAGFVSFLVGNYATSSSAQQFPAQQPVVSCASAINNARALVGSYSTANNTHGFLAVPALTLQAALPPAQSTNPVHITASASGNNPVSQIQVLVNGKAIYHVNGGTMNASITLPTGSNEKLIVQAIDSKGVTTKIAGTVTVR